MISILDYGIGNIRSLKNAFTHLGAEVILTADFNTIMNSDALVIPGVGAFKHGMETLKNSNLDSIIKEFSYSNKPILGICLGFQLMAEQSEEFGITKGLSFLPAMVKKLEVTSRLPHIGWKEIQLPKDNDILNGLFKDITSNSFYFIHSYGVFTKDSKDTGITEYSGCKFSSIIVKDNFIGVQFHPEKSGDPGLMFLRNFLQLVRKK